MQPIEEAADASALMGETKPLPDGSTLSMDPVGDFQLAFGLPVRDTSGLQPVRKQLCESGDMIGEAALSAHPTLLTALDPGCPYVICIHAQRPQQLANFSLEIISDSLLEAELIESSRQTTLNGAWRAANAGGSHIEDGSWSSNPQYAISIECECTVEITLQRPANKWDRQVSAALSVAARESGGMRYGVAGCGVVGIPAVSPRNLDSHPHVC